MTMKRSQPTLSLNQYKNTPLPGSEINSIEANRPEDDFSFDFGVGASNSPTTAACFKMGAEDAVLVAAETASPAAAACSGLASASASLMDLQSLVVEAPEATLQQASHLEALMPLAPAAAASQASLALAAMIPDAAPAADLNSAKSRLQARRMARSKSEPTSLINLNEQAQKMNEMVFHMSPATAALSSGISPATAAANMAMAASCSNLAGMVSSGGPVLCRPKAIRPSATSHHALAQKVAQDFSTSTQQQQQLEPQQQQQQASLVQQPVAIRAPVPVKPKKKSRSSNNRNKYRKRASWYHNVAAKNPLGSITEDPILLSEEEDEDDEEGGVSKAASKATMTRQPALSGPLSSLPASSAAAMPFPTDPYSIVQQAKQNLLQEINKQSLVDNHACNSAGAEPQQQQHSAAYGAALQALTNNYDASKFDPRVPPVSAMNWNDPYMHYYSHLYGAQQQNNQYRPYDPFSPQQQQQPQQALQLEGIAIAAGKPSLPGCIGRNDQGDPLFKLGTMTFDMFRPTDLVVSVQGTFCQIEYIDRNNLHEVKHIPKNLMEDVRFGRNPVRTYNIVTAFTIESWKPEYGEKSPNKAVDEPIRGVMTTYGFILPYPTQNNRFSVWFTGGSLEVDGGKSNEQWCQIFNKDEAPKRTMVEAGKVLAAKLVMGACVNDELDDDGTLSYSLTRPMASYIDLLYLDKSLLILRGSSGTVYVNVRIPDLSSQAALDRMAQFNTGSEEFVLENDGCDSGSPVVDPFGDATDPFGDATAALKISDGDDNDCFWPSGMDAGNQLVNSMPDPLRRRAMSESGVNDFQDSDMAATSRLAELESFLADQEQAPASKALEKKKKKPSLKKTSSYNSLADMDDNEEIPITFDKKAWQALPAPKKAKEEKPQKKGGLLRSRSNLTELFSDPSVLVKVPDRDDESTAPESLSDDDDHAETSPQEARRLRKSVSFSSLEIRNYDQTIGDNPSVGVGAPISLDWTYQDQIQLPVIDYERAKRACGNKKKTNEIRLSAAERCLRLRHEFGFSLTDIRAAADEADKIKHQREQTKHQSASSIAVENVVEAVQRKAKHFVKRLTPGRSSMPGVAGVA